MRLWILSDLHAEQNGPAALPEPDVEFDVAVIAGDVHGSCAAAVEWLAATPRLQGKPVIFVPGNHEFFGSVLQDNLAAGLEAAAHTDGRVHLLHRERVTVGAVRFLGCTLWTDYRLLGSPKVSMVMAGQELDDHRLIRYREGSGHISRFMPWLTAAEHRLDLAFIADELAKSHEGPTVVVTHHLPSGRSIAPRFSDSPLNPTFASDLNWLIRERAPALWVHGHTHEACDFQIEGTRVLCNPLGYRSARDNGFRPDLIVQLDDGFYATPKEAECGFDQEASELRRQSSSRDHWSAETLLREGRDERNTEN